MNKQRSGFTLIELLTVIAIIGILASILIPVVGKVRESARRSVCGSNLRQLGMGILMYANDHGERLPGPGPGQNINRSLRSPRQLPDTAWNNRNSIHLAVHIEDYVDRADDIWLCPSNMEARRIGDRDISYLLNHRVNGTVPNLPFGTAGGYPKRLFDIEAAGKTGKWAEATELSMIWMISDIDSENYGGYLNFPPAGAGGVPYAHTGGRNFAFFDGHVEYRTSNNWPANP